MDRFFYEDVYLLTTGPSRYLIFDHRRGVSEEEYALAVCTRRDDAERIVGALNADAHGKLSVPPAMKLIEASK